MDSLLQIEICLILILALWIYSGIVEFKKRKWLGLLYNAKEFVNSNRWLVNYIFCFYVVLGSISVSPAIKTWADNLTTNTSPLTNVLINKGIPIVWMIFTLYVVIRIMVNSHKPILKYTEQEKLWAKEDKEHSKIRQWFKKHFAKVVKDEI